MSAAGVAAGSQVAAAGAVEEEVTVKVEVGNDC